MHLVFSGSRKIRDEVVVDALAEDAILTIRRLGLSQHLPPHLYVGDADGVDFCIRRSVSAAYNSLYGNKLAVFRAEWAKYKKAAGTIRNERMIDTAIANATIDNSVAMLVAIWDGQSPGTHHASSYAAKRGIHQICYVLKGTFEDQIEAVKTVFEGRKVLWTECVQTHFYLPLYKDELVDEEGSE